MKRLADELNKTNLSLMEKFALMTAASYLARMDMEWCLRVGFGTKNLQALQGLIDASEENAQRPEES